jgi:hypothetical protein
MMANAPSWTAHFNKTSCAENYRTEWLRRPIDTRPTF